MGARSSLRQGLVAVALAALVAVPGCVPVAGGAGGGDPFEGDALRYGVGPDAAGGAVFQPDVVFVEGGPSAVRAAGGDGMTWVIDAAAPGAGDIEAGRVLFLTGRAVGRVIQVTHEDGVVSALLAPVEITEVIQDGEFASDGPVDLERVIAHEAPDAFWGDSKLNEEAGVVPEFGIPPEVVPAGMAVGRATPTPPPLPPPAVSGARRLDTGNFTVGTTCCSDGVGVEFGYDRGGGRIAGKLTLALSSPSARFNLKIAGGSVVSAEFLLRGAGGIHAELTAATAQGSPLNGHSPPLGLNMEFSVPVDTLLGVPFSVTVTQMANLRLNVPGGASATVTGDFKLTGDFGFSYSGGALVNETGLAFDSNAAMDASGSIAVGISSINLDYHVTFRIGIGAFGFTAGLHTTLSVVVTAVYGAPIGFGVSPDGDPIQQCKSLQVGGWVGYGVGYTIPKPVAKLINYFLRAFGTKPIEASGGPHGARPVYNHVHYHPDVPICRS